MSKEYIVTDEELEIALRRYLNSYMEVEKKDIEPFLNEVFKSKKPIERLSVKAVDEIFRKHIHNWDGYLWDDEVGICNLIPQQKPIASEGEIVKTIKPIRDYIDKNIDPPEWDLMVNMLWKMEEELSSLAKPEVDYEKMIIEYLETHDFNQARNNPAVEDKDLLLSFGSFIKNICKGDEGND